MFLQTVILFFKIFLNLVANGGLMTWGKIAMHLKGALCTFILQLVIYFGIETP